MLENGRARAVSEKHARIAIGPIRDRAQLFRADDKHGLVSMRGDELLPDFDSEQETGARRRDIEAGGILRADLLLHETRRCWEQHVGRSSCDQDQVDVFGRDFRLLERFQGSFRRHIARLLIFRRDPAFFNTSARRDPFVARVDDLHEVGVGQALFRHVTAGANDRDRPVRFTGARARARLFFHGGAELPRRYAGSPGVQWIRPPPAARS